jgi:hypothetical protein
MEFFVFLLLLIWFIRWNKRRRGRTSAIGNDPSAMTQLQSSVTHLWSANAQSPVSRPTADEGWFRDPTSRYALRYWNGKQWTAWVSSPNRQVQNDPIVANIPLPGATTSTSNIAPPRYSAPEPGSQLDGPDLNELRRRFNS